MAVITISRQFGSGGEAVARLLAERLGYLLVNKKMIVDNLQSYSAQEDYDHFDLFDEKNLRTIEHAGYREIENKRRLYLEAMHSFIYDLAMRENIVLLGRGGQALFKDFPSALHVKIIAPLKYRLNFVCKSYALDEVVAARLITEQDQDRQDYLRQMFGYDWFALDLYHLVINTAFMGLEESVALVVNAAKTRMDKQEATGVINPSPASFLDDLLQEQEGQGLGQEQGYGKVRGLLNGHMIGHIQDATGNAPLFAHPSEEEFAKMLDFYQIEWLYEPKTFPLEWDSEGNITVAFSPDFYLPEQDLYVELTTQKQKLVWKKNKKIRRLKEIYPQIKIKIIYGRDYRGLLQKYGIEDKQ